jgi:molybdopterin biosynthesis enzyme
MKGFFKVQTPDEVYKKLSRFKPLSSEKVSLEESLHRILTEDIISTVNLPEFPVP